MKKLNIFVSSTCYDLSQIRVDLHEFIEASGHNPILSEFKNFPIHPSNTTIENCISAVNDDADIFVLIVGNRYGCEIETGLSITNTEFLAAKNKKIPIYIFIDKKILNILPVWQKNKSGNFKDIVDSTKIFEFISELRNELQFWTFEFEKAQDIILILKTQMSYLFKKSLEIRSKFNTDVDELFKQNLSNEALNIILTKGLLYEPNFFMQTLIDELKKIEPTKNDYEYKIFLESKHTIYENEDLIQWVQQRFYVLTNLVESLNSVFNKVFPFYFSEPGIPSDLKGLYYTSKTYARIFENILAWNIETSSACVNDECISLRDKLAKLSSKLINDLWNYPFEQKKAINRAIELNGVSEIKATLVIQMDNNDLTEYMNEFENFKVLIFKRYQ